MADRQRHAKKIDTVHWTLGGFVSIALASGGVAAVTAFPAQHLPETLLRTRGEWIANLSASIGSGVGAEVAVGMIQVPEGTGTTVLWDPLTDGDAPWIWWDVLNLIYKEMVTDAVWSSNTSDGRRVIDSKAMRKLRNTELQIVVANSALAGLTGGVIDATGTMRVLSGS